MNKQNAADFSQGSIGSRIMAQAIPLSLAEIVQLLYNIVDRIFLGHLPDGNTLALTGVGLIFPVVYLRLLIGTPFIFMPMPLSCRALSNIYPEYILNNKGDSTHP